MKQSCVWVVLHLSITLSLVSAKALLAVFDSTVALGQTYEVEWLSDTSDTLELLLVRQTDSGWTAIETLFENVVGDPPGNNYNWTVNSTLETGSGYGLWLSSTPVDSTDGSGYADLTDWFCITADENGICSSTSSSSSTLTSTSVTSSATTSTVVATTSSPTANSTSISGTLASQTAAADNNVTSSGNNDDGLSTGVIAGIVLGALIGIAVILLIILWMLRRKHKEREAKAAAAELNAATDEDRRPELGTDDKSNRHELHGGSDMKQPIEKDGEAFTSSDDSASTMRKEKPQQQPVEMP